MKKISKVATASVLLFTLANPLAVFAENRVGNVQKQVAIKQHKILLLLQKKSMAI